MFNNPFSRPASTPASTSVPPASSAPSGLNANTGALVPFGSQPQTSLFGSTSTFGSSVQQPPSFGPTSTTISPFGANSSTTTNQTTFGTTTSNPSPFASSNPSSFGAQSSNPPSFGTTASTPSIFSTSTSTNPPQPSFNTGSTTGFNTSSSSGFGTSATPFGSVATSFPSTTPFGVTATNPPSTATTFGSSSTVPFSNSPSQPAPTTTFGGTPTTFGSSSTSTSTAQPFSTGVFGSTTTQPSSFLSSTTPSTLFGGSTSSSSPFGSTTTPSFGSSSSTNLATTQPFGSSLFGAAPTTGSALASSFNTSQPGTIFGTTQTTASPFGGSSGSAFGPTPGFGVSTSFPTAGVTQGTGTPPYVATTDTDNQTTLHLQSISAMPAFIAKSVEELRLEDYNRGKKAPGYGQPTPTSTQNVFGGTTIQPFGTTTAPGTSLFPSTPGSSLFNQTGSTPSLSTATTTPAGPIGFSSSAVTPFAPTATAFPSGSTPFTSMASTTTFPLISGSTGSSTSTFPSLGATTATTTFPSSSSTLGFQSTSFTGAPTFPSSTQPLTSTFPSTTPQPSFSTPNTTAATGITGFAFGQPAGATKPPFFSLGNTSISQPSSTTTLGISPGFGNAAPSTTPFGQTPISSSTPSSSLFTPRPSLTAPPTPLTPFTQPWSIQTPVSTPNTTSTTIGASSVPLIKQASQFGKHPWLDAPESTPIVTAKPAAITSAQPPTSILKKLGKSTLVTDTATKQPQFEFPMESLKEFHHRPITSTLLSPSPFTIRKSLKSIIVDFSPSTASKDAQEIQPLPRTTAHTSSGPQSPTLTLISTPTPTPPTENKLSGSRSRVQSLHNGFYISPPISDILNSGKPFIVNDLLIGRKHFGDISFLVPVDLSFMPTDSERSFLLRLFGQEAVQDDEPFLEKGPIVIFGPRSVTLYPEGKPPVMTELNVPARIRLEGCFPRRIASGHNSRHGDDQSVIDTFINKLRSVPDTTFISYEEATGLWTFSVEHF